MFADENTCKPSSGAKVICIPLCSTQDFSFWGQGGLGFDFWGSGSGLGSGWMCEGAESRAQGVECGDKESLFAGVGGIRVCIRDMVQVNLAMHVNLASST